MSKPTYILHLVPVPNYGIAPEQRLKALLKRALRNHGLKCVVCKETADSKGNAS